MPTYQFCMRLPFEPSGNRSFLSAPFERGRYVNRGVTNLNDLRPARGVIHDFVLSCEGA